MTNYENWNKLVDELIEAVDDLNKENWVFVSKRKRNKLTRLFEWIKKYLSEYNK